jgi:hypothetical protein
MFKKLNIIILCLFLLLSLAAAGCGGIEEKAVEKTIEKLIEAENKANEDKAEENGSETSIDSSDQDSSVDSSKKDPESSQVEPASDKKEILEDYPGDFCPIYEPSVIVDMEQINVEDKVNYIIKFVSKDEMDTIKAFYLELDYVVDELSLGDVISQIYLENKSEKTCGMINLERVEESDFASYASDGYKIYGSIMVDIGW